MLRYLCHAAAIAAIIAASSAATAADIVVESRTGGQNFDNYQELTTNWVDSNTPAATAKSAAPGLTPASQIGSRKAAFSQAERLPTNVNPAIARFMPKVTEAGKYFVYATWPKAANATPVDYTVKHAGGATVKTISQNGWGAGGADVNANLWVPLGQYDFSPADDQYVEIRISNNAKPVDIRNIGQVYADAVRFSTTEVTEAIYTGQLLLPSPSAPEVVAPPAGTFPAPGAVAPAAGLAPSALVWSTDLIPAQQEARASGKKILVFFAAAESATAQHFENAVFTSPEVAAALAGKYVLVKVNFATSTDLAYKLQVFRAGTINIYDSYGSPLAQITDRLSASEFAARVRGL